MFSILIPTKDRPDMLARALRSALAQRGADFEIVVADDGSGEGAAAAAAMVPERLKTIVTGRLGQVPARNLAVAAAAGRWIAFLDDDDWWAAEDHLVRLAAALQGGGGLAYASGRIVYEGGAAGSGDAIAFAAHIDRRSIRRDNTLLVSGIAYDRDLHQVLGRFDETLPHYWDWDWYLRLAAADVRFAAAGSDGVRISTRIDNVSSAANEDARRIELQRLSAKHGLGALVLKNHEVIAREQRGNRAGVAAETKR